MQQLSLVPQGVVHAFGRAFDVMGEVLDVLVDQTGDEVFADLVRGVKHPERGREGMSAREVLGVLVIKQMRGLSYGELAFHLADSNSSRRLLGYGMGDRVPSAQTLQRNIKKLRPSTLKKVNDALIAYAVEQKVETGARTRVDCTVTEANIHEPTDSALLDDCVRVLSRLLHRAKDLVGTVFTDHTRRARRRAIGIQHAGTKKKRLPLYKDLIKVGERTQRAAERALKALEDTDQVTQAIGTATMGELEHYIELTKRVLDQTRRRILFGESVPSTEKVVSIFEPHTDIIRKDRRDTYYGHKLCLANGVSGLFTDCTIEKGNPSDTNLAIPMVERHIELFARAPAEVAFDGGFASKANLDQIKNLGTPVVSFSKKRGLTVEAMVGSSRLYRILKNFRAGIEAWISFLKRSFGLNRCTWRGFESFKSYVWGSIIAANLLTLARHLLD